MKHKYMQNVANGVAQIRWMGSIADPAHLELFKLQSKEEVTSGGTTVIRYKWIGFSGTRLIYWTIRFLGWQIERYIAKIERNK